MNNIVLPEKLDVLLEQARLARMYRPYFRQVAIGTKQFSPAARRVAAQTFMRGIARAISDASTRAYVLNIARVEFARHMEAN
jgi:hypothetical protein